jgi:hypothetical protein
MWVTTLDLGSEGNFIPRLQVESGKFLAKYKPPVIGMNSLLVIS